MLHRARQGRLPAAAAWAPTRPTASASRSTTGPTATTARSRASARRGGPARRRHRRLALRHRWDAPCRNPGDQGGRRPARRHHPAAAVTTQPPTGTTPGGSGSTGGDERVGRAPRPPPAPAPSRARPAAGRRDDDHQGRFAPPRRPGGRRVDHHDGGWDEPAVEGRPRTTPGNGDDPDESAAGCGRGSSTGDGSGGGGSAAPVGARLRGRARRHRRRCGPGPPPAGRGADAHARLRQALSCDGSKVSERSVAVSDCPGGISSNTCSFRLRLSRIHGPGAIPGRPALRRRSGALAGRGAVGRARGPRRGGALTDGHAVLVVPAWETSGDWTTDGSASPRIWLANHTGAHKTVAGALRTTGLEAHRMPHVSAAATQGALPLSHLHLLTRARRRRSRRSRP